MFCDHPAVFRPILAPSGNACRITSTAATTVTGGMQIATRASLEAMFAARRCIRHCPANGTGAHIPFVSVPTVSKTEMSHALA